MRAGLGSDYRVLHSKKLAYCSCFVVLCCGQLTSDFAHILQGYFTSTGAIRLLPQCQWSNPEDYGLIDHMNPLRAHNITTTNMQNKTVCMIYRAYCRVMYCVTCLSDSVDREAFSGYPLGFTPVTGFNTRPAARFLKISSAILNGVIWSENVRLSHRRPQKFRRRQVLFCCLHCICWWPSTLIWDHMATMSQSVTYGFSQSYEIVSIYWWINSINPFQTILKNCTQYTWNNLEIE